MPRFEGSLRVLIQPNTGMPPDAAMKLFSQVLDGVEAAHLQNVTHRDLKPENVLITGNAQLAAVCDFGVASFSEDHRHTLVQTAPTTRLANFQYAAPEQRVPGSAVTARADVYALGLMLNELFTGSVPHGTDYRPIGSTSPTYSFLDAVVAAMLRQNPSHRPASIAEVKGLIQRHQSEAVSLQKLDTMRQVVVPEGEITDPLAFEPPRLISASYDSGTLILQLDRVVSPEWVQALGGMRSYASVYNLPPSMFRFSGSEARVSAVGNSAQQAIEYFKEWLPVATRELKFALERKLEREKENRLKELRDRREAEESQLEINRRLRI